ncbi:MAG: hypothetical protein RMK99_01670 [Anaerolineales bacterium]|nr:hypothetical protein [Anaerolineales bacterium]
MSALTFFSAFSGPAHAQDEELTLYVRRNFGYSSGSQIQGNFRLEVEGPANLVSVTYFIDDEVLAVTTEPPFRVDFVTDSYPNGWHTLKAMGQTADGRTLVSNTRRFEFVPASVGLEAAGRITIFIFAGVAVVILIVLAVQALVLGRNRTALPPGAARNYGLFGGAVCPRCGRPFPLHLWGLNVGAGRFDRCDHCGKWSVVRRASPEALRAAEAAELAQSRPETSFAESDPEERLRRKLDETKYTE